MTPNKFHISKVPKFLKLKCTDTKDSCIINQNRGPWRNGQFVNYRKPAKTKKNIQVKDAFFTKDRKKIYKKLQSFMAFGDSLTYWFYGSIKEDCIKLFVFCDITYIWSYKLKNNKPMKAVYNGLDFSEKRFLSEIEASMSGKSVFLINFGLHHVGNLPLKRCFKLFQKFIELVKRTRKKLLDKAPLVIWKTTTPPCIENRKNISESKSYWHTFRTKQV